MRASNLPRPIALALANGRATLRELQEFYSVEDVWDLAEAAAVESRNAYLASREQARQHGRR